MGRGLLPRLVPRRPRGLAEPRHLRLHDGPALARLLVFLLPRVIGIRLDNHPRFRRTGLVYLVGMGCYVLMHAICAVLE